ncbi:MAG: hypothetical protein P0Y62_07005 [Candidatus Chryseobacterium colombiense]|nr:hypothetical protein [Chryseobacterium sp.]WEK71301.1 MAG: hypothetical protein P0Y62_07005 [Chryseobacterium sp.]
MKFYFSDDLKYELAKAEKNKMLNIINSWNNPSLKVELDDLNKLNVIHTGIKEYYEKRSDGYELEWASDIEKV